MEGAVAQKQVVVRPSDREVYSKIQMEENSKRTAQDHASRTIEGGEEACPRIAQEQTFSLEKTDDV